MCGGNPKQFISSNKIKKNFEFSIECWNTGGSRLPLNPNLPKPDILGLTETHATGDVKSIGSFIFKSGGGGKDDPAAGVEMQLSERAHKALEFVNVISSRLLLARFRTAMGHLTVIIVYIPQQARKIAPFQSDTYAELATVLVNISRHDCVVVIGDFNGRLGRSNNTTESAEKRYVGPWSPHSKDCAGGVRLREMLHTFDLCAVSTTFQPKKKHTNATWLNPAPASVAQLSQIDHILVSNRWKTNMKCCHTNWARSIFSRGHPSDHASLRATLQLTCRVFKDRRAFDLHKLTVPVVLEKYQAAVKSYLSTAIPSTILEDSQGRWLRLKPAILEAAAASLIPERSTKLQKPYISARTTDLVKLRASEFSKLNGMPPTNAVKKFWKRKIAHSLHDDYKTYVAEIILKMETADKRGHSRELHRLRKKLQGSTSRASSNLTTDGHNNMLVTEGARLERFRMYNEIKFRAPPDRAIIQTNVPINRLVTAPREDALTDDECLAGIAKLPNFKSPGVDEIPIELIRNSPEAISELVSIMQLIWTTKRMPTDWTTGVVVNIYKNKGSKDDPSSYRPICLLSHAYKAFAVVILNRIKVHVDARIAINQEGFRYGRGCADNLYALRMAINYSLRTHRKHDLELTFIDFSQAFDTVDHNFLQISMKEHGLPSIYCELIGAIYIDSKACIKGAKSQLSSPFAVKRGVLQGDILSPILFIMSLNSIWNRTNKTEGWHPIPTWLLEQLTYADDIALLDNSHISSEKRLQELSDVAGSSAAMAISVPKTVRMTIRPQAKVGKTTTADILSLLPTGTTHQCPLCLRHLAAPSSLPSHRRFCKGSPDAEQANPAPHCGNIDKLCKAAKLTNLAQADPAHIQLNGSAIQNVSTFKYLGAQITSHGSDLLEVTVRIRQAMAAFTSMQSIWRDQTLTPILKLRLLRACVLSILLYGAESWTLTKTIVRKLQLLERNFWRAMRIRKFTNFRDYFGGSVEEAASEIGVLRMLDKRRWDWLGHVLRMTSDHNPKLALLHMSDTSPGSLVSMLPLDLHPQPLPPVSVQLPPSAPRFHAASHRSRPRSIKTTLPGATSSAANKGDRFAFAVAAAENATTWPQLFKDGHFNSCMTL
jgi:exonuclease III